MTHQQQLLSRLFTYFKTTLHNSKPPRTYLEQRGLNPELIEVGYNTGELHHGKRKDEQLIAGCIELGLLQLSARKSRTGDQAYTPFCKNCIVFPLRNRANHITCLYFRNTEQKGQQHLYLKYRLLHKKAVSKCFAGPCKVIWMLTLSKAITSN